MKWIKASERLPEKDGFYIADSDWIGDAINEIVPNDRSDTNFLNGKFECGKNWRVTAWLDEASTSDNTQSIDKELAGKIWDAACKFNHEEFMYLERGIHIQAPDKETFINSLNLDNTQIRDGYSKQDIINAWNSAYGGDSFLSGEDYEASLQPL